MDRTKEFASLILANPSDAPRTGATANNRIKDEYTHEAYRIVFPHISLPLTCVAQSHPFTTRLSPQHATGIYTNRPLSIPTSSHFSSTHTTTAKRSRNYFNGQRAR